MITNNSMVNQDKVIGDGEINYTNIILIFLTTSRRHRRHIVAMSSGCRDDVGPWCMGDVVTTSP